MKKTATLILSALLLAACGSKDNVSTARGDEALAGTGGQGQTGQPVDSGEKPPGAGTMVQIACQSVGGLGSTPLPSSQNLNGQRAVDAIPRIAASPDNPNLAPTVLDVRDAVLSALVVSEGRVYFVRYDLAKHGLAEEPVAIGAASSRAAGVYRALGFRQPRLAAASPDGKVFAFSAKGGLSLRAAANPTVPASRATLSGDFAQPRWDGNEIFVDRVSGGRLRQAVVTVGAGYGTLGLRAVPGALDSGFDQIGLRRYDAGSYVWLERDAKRSVLRLWSGRGAGTRNYELPAGATFGPGFALYRAGAEAEPLAVLNSAKGVHYFRLGAHGSVTGDSYPYPEDTQRIIDNPDRATPWYPGAVYSAAGDTQLFAVIPSTFGFQMLMAIDRQFSYRLLGFDQCVNPDFHRVGE